MGKKRIAQANPSESISEASVLNSVLDTTDTTDTTEGTEGITTYASAVRAVDAIMQTVADVATGKGKAYETAVENSRHG